MRRALTAAVTALLLSALPAATATIVIPEGVDLFVVESATANFAGPYAIPADFFGPGSDPFTGVVAMQGVPADPDPNCQAPPDPAEVIIKRNAPINLPDPPASQSIPIEIVQLKLVSVTPITVTFNGGMDPELWKIEIVPIPIPPVPPPVPPIREIIIVRDKDKGGDFTTTYEYDLILRITREIAPFDPPIEHTPPPDQFGGQGPWGIPALPEMPPNVTATGQLSCPACKTDNFYMGYDGTGPVPFALTGQFLTVNLMLACSGPVPVEAKTWGAIKDMYKE